MAWSRIMKGAGVVAGAGIVQGSMWRSSDSLLVLLYSPLNMAWSRMRKGAEVVAGSFLGAGIVHWSMNALAAEREADSGIEKWNLGCALAFDGLNCFETIVSTGKHPTQVKKPSLETTVSIGVSQASRTAQT